MTSSMKPTGFASRIRDIIRSPSLSKANTATCMRVARSLVRTSWRTCFSLYEVAFAYARRAAWYAMIGDDSELPKLFREIVIDVRDGSRIEFRTICADNPLVSSWFYAYDAYRTRRLRRALGFVFSALDKHVDKEKHDKARALRPDVAYIVCDFSFRKRQKTLLLKTDGAGLTRFLGRRNENRALYARSIATASSSSVCLTLGDEDYTDTALGNMASTSFCRSVLDVAQTRPLRLSDVLAVCVALGVVPFHTLFRVLVARPDIPTLYILSLDDCSEHLFSLGGGGIVLSSATSFPWTVVPSEVSNKTTPKE